MTTDSFQGKSDGSKRIKDSVWGLVLVISSWIVLYTINPNLVKELNLNISSIKTRDPFGDGSQLGPTGGTPSQPGKPMTEAEKTESNNIRKELEDAQVNTYRGPCEQGQTTNCVNLNGLDPTLKSNLKVLASVACRACNILLTGGTEQGHSAGSSHYTGNAVDMSIDVELAAYVEKNKVGAPQQTSLGPLYTVNVNGAYMTFLRESNPHHWHVQNK